VTTTYTYDTHGNLTAITDANDGLTSYQYDDMARLVTTTSPDTATKPQRIETDPERSGSIYCSRSPVY